jgi:hypothetical protein
MAKSPSEEPFNPLDKTTLAKNISEHLLRRPIVPLPPERFVGAGIYALYYKGPFPVYEKIAQSMADEDGEAIPIYVGKAVPKGARKGAYDLSVDPGGVLYKRLMDHVASITAVENLELSDFAFRYLLVDDVWIPLGESMLIAIFKPVWNICVDGFGHHHQGQHRRTQKKSAWDTVHPGRPWAGEVIGKNARTVEQIISDITAVLSDQSKAIWQSRKEELISASRPVLSRKS